MKISVCRKEDAKESNWSGGKTWELAIWPQTSVYLDRDFLWRLSTAASDREESSFTKLPDYDRILMVLEGDVVLAHGDERSVRLQKEQQDSFDGAVKTRCFGKLIRDYNLILRKGCEGRMEILQLREKASPVPMSAAGADAPAYYGLFCLEGYAVVSCAQESEMIRPGEQAVICFEEGVTDDIRVMGEGKCILTEVIAPMLRAQAEDDAAEAENGSAAAETADAVQAADGSGDYLRCLKLYFGRNRWAMAMRREGKSDVYYDRALSEALRKIERRYIVELIWLVGVMICILPLFADVNGAVCFAAAVIFTLIHLFGIMPAVYLKLLPRPLSAHMKSAASLNAAEKAYHEEERQENPQLEKLMRKYKSDDENYFADESSPLYKMVKKK